MKEAALMKKLFFLLLFTALFFLHGASPDLTNGVWYLSVPENKGKIRKSLWHKGLRIFCVFGAGDGGRTREIKTVNP